MTAPATPLVLHAAARPGGLVVDGPTVPAWVGNGVSAADGPWLRSPPILSLSQPPQTTAC